MFYPTHRHADGGLYQHLGPMQGKSVHTDDPDWEEGMAYRNEEGMMFWTSMKRWNDRFESLDGAPGHTATIELHGDEGPVASFKFSVLEADDIRYMLITAGPQRHSNLSLDQQDWLKRVLVAQADAITAGLHVREHDFPDMIGDVAAFHAKFGQEYLGKVRMLPQDLHEFRTKFHDEETTEYRDEYERLVDAVTRKDRRDIINCLELQLDALCDAAWVILGTADLQFGRKAFIEAWRRVYKQNMLKVLATDDPNAEDSGREVKYDIRKPAGWMAPDHRDLVSDNAIFDDIFGAPEEEPEFQGFNQDADRYSDTRAV